MTLASELLLLADEIEWLDDQGTFPRKLSWLASRAKEIAAADDAVAARALVAENDFADVIKAAESDSKGYGKTWAGRAMSFLVIWVRLEKILDVRAPPKPAPESTGSRLVVSETRAERAESIVPPPVVFEDEDR
jgi:hypothetical protein